MLLHDSYFLSTNETINKTYYDTITIAYSPLFHATFTLIISIFGFFFNLTCCIKIWFIIYQCRKRKLYNRQRQQQIQEPVHTLSDKKYRFLLILTSNDILLCFSSIISCLDEKFFFQSFLARHHLCSAHILIWKFTLHFIPLLIIVILCRYHYILTKRFQVKSAALSSFKQLLCTDLSILIPLVLALAWSVDGLWLWGVASIKDYIILSSTTIQNIRLNLTKEITMTSSIYDSGLNMTSPVLNLSLSEAKKQLDHDLYLREQIYICYLQTNYNFQFTVRLVHLIQADFLLLFLLHLSALLLEIVLYIRLCCCMITKKVTSIYVHERQLCIYILCMFSTVTLTSIPFYFYRVIEISFDNQFTLTNNEVFNSRTCAQILLFGACFKPLLFFILFFPSSSLFYLKCYLACYSPTKFQIIEQPEEILPPSNSQSRIKKRQSMMPVQRHRYSLCLQSSYYPKSHVRPRTQSIPALPSVCDRQESLEKAEHFNSWLRLTHSIIANSSNEASDIKCV
ncbi:unnamed protein product [Rotaria magnacalcarata]|uniref:Uncharacterized protein n=1 Tax=Rotaria magnacalcarata TaxID=392030 RepID=A0A819NRU6_9BILA|nr:unnamed protein product [Rotaria magnacalcarata]CAF4003809.1 unnamed protein product [Rotaria magnacalcarata]